MTDLMFDGLLGDSLNDAEEMGLEMYKWAVDLFPICRSITGSGVTKTLEYLREIVPEMTIHEVDTGSRVFDWTIPDEWIVRDAYIIDPEGKKIVDFQQNNLHLISYSTSVDCFLERESLLDHLHSLPDQPTAIPYVTSYYESNWGFCVPDSLKKRLMPGEYKVKIDAETRPGKLRYGEIVIPGSTSEEIFVSTYICHPSMANNELSGPVIATALARWLRRLNYRKYTYRIVFVPETIGSLVYLSRHLAHMKNSVVAGFNLTCLGDGGPFSLLGTPSGATTADFVAEYVLSTYFKPTRFYSFLERGSDERQYCSPLANLPVVCLMRSKFGTYPEYHTSLDDLDFISPEELQSSLKMVSCCIFALENNDTMIVKTVGEPQLGRRGLYPNLGTRETRDIVRTTMDVLAYMDGKNSLIDIAKITNIDFFTCLSVRDELLKHDLIEINEKLGA